MLNLKYDKPKTCLNVSVPLFERVDDSHQIIQNPHSYIEDPVRV